MNQGTILGGQIGRWVVLAALVVVLGALLLTIRPVAAQTEGCHTVGTGTASEYVCNLTYAENGKGPVYNLGAQDRDVTQVVKVWELVTDENDPAYSTGFPDYGRFKIDRKSGVLSFRSPPNYENPPSGRTGSLEARNVYKVMAKVGDGEKYRVAEITVQVTGLEEPETLTLSARQPQVGVKLTATLSGGDILGLRTPDWQWQREDGSGWVDIDQAVNRSYTPRAASDDYVGDVGKKLRAYVSYQDSHGVDLTETGDGEQFLIGTGVSEFPVQAEPATNVAPVFREDEDTGAAGMQASRRIEENSAPGTPVGPPLFATDNDHLPRSEGGGQRDVLTYSLSDGFPTSDTTNDTDSINTDDDGLFSIDQETGQIMTKAGLNKEGLTARDLDSDAANGIQLQVTAIATDPSGETGLITVTIHVLDVAEKPEVRGPAALTYFENQTEEDTDLFLFRDPTRVDRVEPAPYLPAPVEQGVANKAIFMAFDNDLLDGDVPSSPFGEIEWQITGDDASKFCFVATATASDRQTAGNCLSGTNPADYLDSTDIDSESRVASSPQLRWRSAPDLEAEADMGGTKGDNVYEITLVAWDEDWEIGRRDVSIRLANSNDAGKVTLSHISPQVGIGITATVTDQDGISEEITWVWSSSSTGAGTVTSSGTTSTYTPVAADDGGTLTATATYTDRRGTPETAADTSSENVRVNPLGGDDATTPDVDESGNNTAPKFYRDNLDVTDDDDTDNDGNQNVNRVSANETTSYVRYVLENQTRNVTFTELEARVYDTDLTSAGVQAPVDALVNAFDGYFEDRDARVADPPEPTDDTANLHFALSGAEAKYFTIGNLVGSTQSPATDEVRGLIRTKGPLNFETKSTYTVTVTATDPAGLTDTATVTINVLDVPEIRGLGSRIRVDENTFDIADISVDNPPDVSLGGIKWSLLTTNEADAETAAGDGDGHNRNHAHSIDCQYDSTNEGLCDDFRFSNFNTHMTTLLFAIGTGEKHDAPNFEKPADVSVNATGAVEDGTDTGDNIYKIRVRAAFANLRSQQLGDPQDAYHPYPRADESQDRTVWIRVDDVDEDPGFAEPSYERAVFENSDDTLPAIAINRFFGSRVTANDPEYGYMDGRQYGKKLTYSLSLPEAYWELFQVVPATGQLLTKSRLNYEALDLTEEGPDGGQYKTIEGSDAITATDSAGNSGDTDVNIVVNDVNETPLITTITLKAGTTEVSELSEDMEDTMAGRTVGSYEVEGRDEVSTSPVTWSVEGPDADDFSISDGVLTLNAVPDYENPMDRDEDPATEGDQGKGNNVYKVTVKATVENDEATREVTVTVTDVNELGDLTGDATASYAEGGTAAVATYTLSGGSMDSAADWSLGGDDAGDFDIAGGSLTFNAAPDYENPMGGADADSNTYMVTVMAMAGGEMETMDVAITVTDVNELGDLTGDATASYAEGGTAAVATYTLSGGSMDSAADWSLGGDDAGDFDIAGGSLTFNAAPDYENPMGGADADSNTYMVTVMAMAGGEMETMDVAITVTDVNELGDLTGDATASYAEGGTAAVATYTLSGGSMDSAADWSLGGDDAGDFDIAGGSLTFNAAPDYENPMGGADADSNTYMVTVMAMAGGEMETMDVAITVTDVNELGDLTGDATASYAEGGTAAVATYTLSGGSMDSAADWSLGGDDAGDFDIAGGSLTFNAAPDYENPMGGADADSNTYMVTVMAMAGGEMETMDVAITVTDVNELGDLTGDATASYAEGGTAAVATYTLSGGSMDSAADWSLGGDDAGDFDIAGGSLTFNAAPDYENPMGGADADSNTYMVTVMAMAGGEMETMDVTITVVNVNEAPMISGDAAVDYAENGTEDVADYTATDPEDGTITWSLSGADMEAFDISDAGALTFKASPNYEAPADTGANRMYNVTVVASDGFNSATLDVTVTVTNVDEEGRVTLSSAVAVVVDTEVTASLTDPDGGVTNTTWQWASADTMAGPFINISGATSASYTVAAGAAGKYLQATASYDDAEGSGKTATSAAVMISADVSSRYDINGTPGIQIDELQAAIDDYFDDGISISDLFGVIEVYFNG